MSVCPSSPTAWSRTTWSKLAVNVLAELSPIMIRPTGVVPVSACHAFTIRTPSRYRSHVELVPTEPQTSTLCHPDPSATVETLWVPATSERIASAPADDTKTLRIAPSVAVRRRSSTMFDPEARLTFSLMHTCG